MNTSSNAMHEASCDCLRTVLCLQSYNVANSKFTCSIHSLNLMRSVVQRVNYSVSYSDCSERLSEQIQ